MISPSLILYPELSRVAPDLRLAALQRARQEPFDWIELAGLGACVVLVAWFTEWISTAAADPGRALTPLASALLAVVLVLAFAGPFYWRRTRRALLGEIARHEHDDRRAAP